MKQPAIDLNQPFATYRVFDANGQALYVGMGQNPYRRISKHANQNERMRYATRIEFTWHATLAEAIAAEREEIQQLDPVLNIRHAPTGHAREPGELMHKVLAAVEELGECTSSDVRKMLLAEEGLHSSAIPACMRHLRLTGRLEVVGKRWDGHRTGNPQFVVKVAA